MEKQRSNDVFEQCSRGSALEVVFGDELHEREISDIVIGKSRSRLSPVNGCSLPVLNCQTGLTAFAGGNIAASERLERAS